MNPRFMLGNHDERIFPFLHDIVAIQAAGSQSHFFVIGQPTPFTVHKNLGYYHALLTPFEPLVYRISRTFLINLLYVQGYDNNTHLLTLLHELTVKVPENQLNPMLTAIAQYERWPVGRGIPDINMIYCWEACGEGKTYNRSNEMNTSATGQ